MMYFIDRTKILKEVRAGSGSTDQRSQRPGGLQGVCCVPGDREDVAEGNDGHLLHTTDTFKYAGMEVL